MKKVAILSGLILALGVSTLSQAHPEYPDCPKYDFWKGSKAAERCQHSHEEPETTIVEADEKHVVYFEFDRSDVGDMTDILDYIDSLKQLEAISLIGHADRLGTDDYNNLLSQFRVNAVADKLIEHGIDANLISTDYMGESTPVLPCDEVLGVELIDCLSANRRVELTITGQKEVTL